MPADLASRWVRCRLPAAAEDAVAELAAKVEALGVLLEPAGELIVATVHLPAARGDLVERCLRQLGELAVAGSLESGEQGAADWLERYREHVRPFPVGDTWFIDPHPDLPTAAPPGRVRLALEPRMAFGTGSHESTQLLLLWLERQDLGGCRVLDVGTGSGVLSFAAVLRGARSTVSHDIDLQAVLVARQTARAQDRVMPVGLLAGPLASVRGHFGVVLCNMVPEHALPLLGALVERLAEDGRLVLSGLLDVQRDEVVAALDEHGLALREEWSLGEWTALEAGRG